MGKLYSVNIGYTIFGQISCDMCMAVNIAKKTIPMRRYMGVECNEAGKYNESSKIHIARRDSGS